MRPAASRQARIKHSAELPKRWTLRSLPTFVMGAAATTGAILITLGVRADRRRPAFVESVLRTWARAWLLPAGVQLQVEGLEHLVPGQRYVVVSNHQSNLDPIVHLAALPVPLRFLAMRELFDLPVLGGTLRRIGMIEVDRRKPDSGGIADGVARALADGANVFVYPEGATSHDGSLNRFRLGAFTLALDHGISILPISTIGTREIWAPGSNAIHRGVVRVIIHAPIATDDSSAADAIDLLDRARSTIAAALGSTA